MKKTGGDNATNRVCGKVSRWVTTVSRVVRESPSLFVCTSISANPFITAARALPQSPSALSGASR